MPNRNQHQQSSARNDASLRLEDLNTQVSRSGDLVHFCIFYNAIIIVFMTGPPYWCHFDAVLFHKTVHSGCSKITYEDIVEYVSSKPDLDFLGVAWRQGETCETVARRRTFTADKVRREQSQCQVAAMLSAQHETSPGKDRKCKHELHWWAVIQNTYCLYCTLSYRNDNTII